MSSDYRPRGGGSGSSSGGGRRRRGGRNRGGAARPHGEHRSHSNGTTPHAPAKKESPIAKLFGWLTGKKKQSEPSRPASSRPSSPRSEFRSPEPRAERPRREDRPPRPEPTPQEITTPKLYVGNLSYDAAESDLFDLFSKVGEVKIVEVAKDRHSGRSKGFGFVEMAALETAKEAADKFNRTDFMGRQIVVSGAKLEKRSAPAPHENEGESTETESNI
jgi:RNA recognition motif-containing protein